MRMTLLKTTAAMLVGMVAGAVLLPGAGPEAQSASSDTFRSLKLFGDVFERVRAEYVEEVSDQMLIETAINGMLSSLDPHSSYLDTERYRDMQVQTRGEFGGLGIEVTMENGLVKVVSPIDDTPAFRAGIEAGDFITHIDGEPVMGLTLSEAVERMRGPVESKIALARHARGQGGAARGQPRPSRDQDLAGAGQASRAMSAIVRLTTFNEQTSSAMRDEIEKLKSQSGDKMRGSRARPAQQSRRPARPGGGGRPTRSSTRARSSRRAGAGPTASSASMPGPATCSTTCRSSC